MNIYIYIYSNCSRIFLAKDDIFPVVHNWPTLALKYNVTLVMTSNVD